MRVVQVHEHVLRVRRHEQRQWISTWTCITDTSISFAMHLKRVEAITGPKPLDVLSCRRTTTERASKCLADTYLASIGQGSGERNLRVQATLKKETSIYCCRSPTGITVTAELSAIRGSSCARSVRQRTEHRPPSAEESQASVGVRRSVRRREDRGGERGRALKRA